MTRQLIIILFLLPAFAFAQVKNIGLPKIHNFTKSEYSGGTQNWDIAQDELGFMYFANKDGVLRYDGVNWDLIPVPIFPARSIIVDSKNRLFVGLNNDFGFIESNNNGQYIYTSLKHLIPEDCRLFTDVWKIHEIEEGIVFHAFECVFIYNGNEIKTIKPKEKFHFSFHAEDRLFLQEPGVGLYEYSNSKIEQLPWANQLINKKIWSILPFDDKQLLIGTAAHGFYKYSEGVLEKWETEASQFVEENKLFSSSNLANNYFAFGSILGGAIICDNDGNITQQINRKSGLQNNTVLSAFVDKSRNLWLGLDNGIDYLEINSPLSFITAEEGIGTGYASCIHNDFLYLGTNQGLFYRPYNLNGVNNYEPFKMVENTTGQIWSLEVFEGQLICGHNLGTFEINGNRANKISAESGAWRYIKLKNHDNYLIGGHYSGLVLLKKENGSWVFHKKIKGYNESIRFLIEDEKGNIWVSHDNRGVVRLTLGPNLDNVIDTKRYGEQEGLPSNESNRLLQLDENWIISGIDGLYKYDPEVDNFSRHEELNKMLNVDQQIKFLKFDVANNLWYITDNGLGLIHQNEDNSFTKITTPFKQLENKFVREFESLYPYSPENTLIAIEDGFAHYSSRVAKSYADNFNVYITKVEVNSLDSIINLPFISNRSYKFPFSNNSFRFYYAATYYENPGALKFSYYIDNYSEEWSTWSSDSYHDFNNFKENDYVFRIKARNVYGVESETTTFEFSIEPPWYRSKVAYYIYIFLVLALALLITSIIQKRFELSKQKERLKHQEELKRKEDEFKQQALLTDKEIMKLRNEKLRTEKTFLDKELANQTMNIIQKNKFLMKLNQELKRLQEETLSSSVKTKLVIIKKRIDKEIDDDRQNKVFESYFDEVHVDFFNRLKQTYPQLSPKDLRLSAYIRMDISTKEIATLLNISDRGVEISRYRLRKKMELSREVNLSTFLSNI